MRINSNASCCVAQDHAILKSPVAVKKFLNDQSISYDPGTDAYELRGMAKARMKRIANEGVSDNAKKKLFKTARKTLSFDELKQVIDNIGNDNLYESHVSATFTIEDISGLNDITTKKHSTIYSMCTGKIRDGVCINCYEETNGVDAYSFKAKIAKIKDDSKTLNVTCSEGAGKSMFGMSATEWNELTTDKKKDAIENILCRAVTSGVWLKGNKTKPGDVMIVLYDVARVIDEA